jgi:hypothetical protein
MDEFFIRELLIFLGISAIFIGSVPMLLRGHHAESVDDVFAGKAPAGAAAGGSASADDAHAAIKVSRKRKARARDAARKPT